MALNPRSGGRVRLVPTLALLAATPLHGGTTDAASAMLPPLAAFTAEADRWLFAGEMAPADLPIRLARLTPAERLLAIAYLRRAGVFKGPAFTSDFMLAPATPEAER